jgi:hypothetical protein
MKNVNIVIACSLVGIMSLACVKDSCKSLDEESPASFEILQNCYESPRVTFGKIPKDTFYNTVFDYIKINNVDLKHINEDLFHGDASKLTDFQYFTVIYTSKIYNGEIKIASDDIVGFGIASFDNGHIIFKLYKVENSLPKLIKSMNFKDKFPTRIFEYFKKDLDLTNSIKSMIFVANGDKWKHANQGSPSFDSLVQVMTSCQIDH